MPRYLALDWDQNLLHIVAANVGRGSVHIQQALAWPQDKNPGSADVEALGAIVRERLKDGGIAPAPVIVSVGRDRVILKDIRFPQVPAAEEPAIVRFQAAKELTEPDEVVIDYTVSPDAGPSGERRAQALIFRRQLLNVYQGICRAAGLKLAGVSPRPFGIAACVARAAGAAPADTSDGDAAGADAVLTVSAGWAEFCVVRDGRPLFTRALAPGANLVGDIRRNLALYAGQPAVIAARDRVRALYVAGNGEHAVLREQLEKLLAIPVHPLDPFAGIERLDVQGSRGGFAGAVGLLHAQAGSSGLPINFASPKDAAPTRNPHRERVLVGALVALLVLVGGFVICNRMLAVRTDTIAELRGEVSDLDISIALVGKDSERLRVLEGWTGAAVSWLDELADISHRFPQDAKLIRLREFTGTTAPGKGAGKKPVGTMTFIADFTGDEREVSKLVDRLNDNSLTSNYRVAAKTILPATDDKAPGTGTVTVKVEIEPVAATSVGQKGGKNGEEAMTQREQKMLYGVGGAAALVVGLVAFNSMFLAPLRTADQEIVALRDESSSKQLDLAKKLADKKEMARLKGISLPADPNPLHRDVDLASNEYDKHLRELLRASGMKSVRITNPTSTASALGAGAAKNAKPLYQALTYRVDASGATTSLVALLERFYRTPLLHQIKGLTIRPAKVDSAASRTRRPGPASRDLDVSLTIEALVVDGAQKRSYLLPASQALLAVSGLVAIQGGPAGVPMVPWAVDRSGLLLAKPLLEPVTTPGQHAYIAQRNIFYGPPTPKDPAQKRKPPTVDPNRYLVLTDIIRRSDGKAHADLYNQLKGGRPIKLDPADDAHNSIAVCKDTEDDVLVRGEVVYIGRIEVVFRLKLASRKERGEDNGEKFICMDEAKRLYRMRKSYWEALEEEETLTSTAGTSEGSNFVLRGKIIGGTVVVEDDRDVVIEIYPKYFDRLYSLRVDESLDTAIQEPLTPKEIRELGVTTAVKAEKK